MNRDQELDNHLVKLYAFVQDDYHQWYTVNSPFD